MFMATPPPPRHAHPVAPIVVPRQTLRKVLICSQTTGGVSWCVWVRLPKIHSPRFP